MTDDTLDLPAAAAFLNLHPSTLQARAKAGKIPGAKPGRAWVFLRSDLIAYLKGLQCPSTASETSTTLTSRQAEAALDAVLGPRTGKPRRSGTTSSRQNLGGKFASVTLLRAPGQTP
jgi:excisionase family DNA binding protein